MASVVLAGLLLSGILEGHVAQGKSGRPLCRGAFWKATMASVVLAGLLLSGILEGHVAGESIW
jgi:hypothetical protein